MKLCELCVALIALVCGINFFFPASQEALNDFWVAAGMFCVLVTLVEILPKFIRRVIKDPDFAFVLVIACTAGGIATAMNMGGVDFDTCVWIMYAILFIGMGIKIAAKLYIRKKSENKI